MKINKFYLLFGLLALIYMAVTLSIPPDPASVERFKVTPLQLRLLGLSVSVPLLLIWFAAFYGFTKIKEYAEEIKDSNDGKALNAMTNGLMVLAVGSPIVSTINSILNFEVRSNESFRSTAVLTNGYLTLLMNLIAFLLLMRGAGLLLEIVHGKRNSIATIVLTLVLGTPYGYLTMINPNRSNQGVGAAVSSFLPDIALLLTVIVPYVFIWYVGFTAATDIMTYRKNVPGTIYKKALEYLAFGILAIIGTNIVLQFISTAGTFFQGLNLGALLLVVYALLILISLGYIFIATGAKKLHKIEQVV